MNYHDQFASFDPLKGNIPYWPFPEGNSIISRARSILYGRTNEEIGSLAADADQIIEAFFDHEKDTCVEMLKNEGRHDLLDGDEDGNFLRVKDEAMAEYDIRTSENTSDLDALQEALDQGFFDPTTVDVPNVNEYEYFAVMALCSIGDLVKAMELEINYKTMTFVKRTSNKYDSTDMGRMGKILINAMEAVCYAERLREVERTKERYEDRIQKIQATHKPITKKDIARIHSEVSKQLQEEEKARRKQQSQERNLIRHQSNHDAQKIVLEMWEKNPREFSSAEKAGDHYLDILDARGIKRSHRTVVDWIRARAKELSIRFR